MSGMRMMLEQLSPEMRKQAKERLAKLNGGEKRAHVCSDTAPGFAGKVRNYVRDKGLIPKLSEPEERLAFHLKAEGLKYEREYKWHPRRKFRADFAFPSARLLVEVQGAIYSRGRHVRGSGYENDRLKIQIAMLMGWRVLEFTPGQIKSGRAAFVIKKLVTAS